MRCKKCAYEIGLAAICPMCGVDQGHIKKSKKNPWEKRAFYLIGTSGKTHKKIVRNAILGYFMFMIGIYMHFTYERASRMSIIPVGILINIYMTYNMIIGYIQPGLDKTKEFKVKARLSTGCLIFYGLFVLLYEYNRVH